MRRLLLLLMLCGVGLLYSDAKAIGSGPRGCGFPNCTTGSGATNLGSLNGGTAPSGQTYDYSTGTVKGVTGTVSGNPNTLGTTGKIGDLVHDSTAIPSNCGFWRNVNGATLWASQSCVQSGTATPVGNAACYQKGDVYNQTSSGTNNDTIQWQCISSGISTVAAWTKPSNSDAEALAACQSGVIPGGGFDASTGKYRWTCGGYNFSGVVGGTPYSSPTTIGGNSETFVCTAKGVGTSQTTGLSINNTTDVTGGGKTALTGTTTTDIKVTGGGLTVNAYQGDIIEFDSPSVAAVAICTGAGTPLACCTGNGAGATCTAKRSIVSNTATDIIVESTYPFQTAPVNGNSFKITNPITDACWDGNMVIRQNAMADIMLAEDNTTFGGKVYLPAYPGKNFGIYVDRGCGVQSTNVANNCPILSAPLNQSFTHKIEMFGGIQLVGMGKLNNIAPTGGLSMAGTWVLLQTGRWQTGLDPGTGTTVIAQQNISSGMVAGTRTCTPTSSSNPACTVTIQAAQDRPTSNLWGNTTALYANYTRGSTMCLRNDTATTGTCRGQRQIVCTASGGTLGSGGCGVGVLSSDICDGFVDAVQNDFGGVTTLKGTFSSMNGDESGLAGTFYGTEIPILSANGAACGVSSLGKLVTLNQAFTSPFMQVGTTNIATITTNGVEMPDWPRLANAGGGYKGINFAPVNSYGGPSGRCSQGTTAGTGDESECDSSEMLALEDSDDGGFDSVSLYYGSTIGDSNVDGNVLGWHVYLKNSLISDSARGVTSDMSTWDYDNDVWRRNTTTGTIINMFTGWTTLKNQRFEYNISTNNLISFGAGMYNTVKDSDFISNQATTGIFAINNGKYLNISHIRVHMTYGMFATIGPTNTFKILGPINIDDVVMTGPINTWSGVANGQAAIWLTDFNNNGSYNNAANLTNGLRIHNFHVQSDQTAPCLVAIDNANVPNPATNSANNVLLDDSSMDTTGTVPPYPFCQFIWTANSNATTAGSDVDDTTTPLRWRPRSTNVSINQYPVADWNYPQRIGNISFCTGAAAPHPCCTANGVGATCPLFPTATIQNQGMKLAQPDAVTAGTCNGTTGGGTKRAVCKSTGAAWATE